MPAGADGTAKGRAVIARRVDAVYLVERHGTFVRHGARARACCNDAPLSQRQTTKLLLNDQPSGLRLRYDDLWEKSGKPREQFLNSSDHPGAAHDEHHRDPHPPSVHLHHRLRHGDPRPVAQLHDPSAHEARGPRRRPCPRVFVPGAWFTFSAVPRASSRCAPRLTSPPRPAADRRAPRGRRGRARRQAAQVHGGVTARTRALFPGRTHELRRLSRNETRRRKEAHTTFCLRKNIFH